MLATCLPGFVISGRARAELIVHCPFLLLSKGKGNALIGSLVVPNFIVSAFSHPFHHLHSIRFLGLASWLSSPFHPSPRLLLPARCLPRPRHRYHLRRTLPHPHSRSRLHPV